VSLVRAQVGEPNLKASIMKPFLCDEKK